MAGEFLHVGQFRLFGRSSRGSCLLGLLNIGILYLVFLQLEVFNLLFMFSLKHNLQIVNCTDLKCTVQLIWANVYHTPLVRSEIFLAPPGSSIVSIPVPPEAVALI